MKLLRIFDKKIVEAYSIIFSSHANPPPEVVVTDTAASSTTERFESTTSSGQQTTTTISETVVTKTSGYSSTVVEVNYCCKKSQFINYKALYDSYIIRK